MAAAVYEVGRPKRFSREEAEQLDAEWRDFGGKCRLWRACCFVEHCASLSVSGGSCPAMLPPEDPFCPTSRGCNEFVIHKRVLPRQRYPTNTAAAMQWGLRGSGCSAAAACTSLRSRRRSGSRWRNTAARTPCPTTASATSFGTGIPTPSARPTASSRCASKTDTLGHISYRAIHVLPTQHASQRCLLGLMTQLARIEVWRIISVCAGAGRLPQAAHRPLQRRGVWHRWRPHCGRFVKAA